MSDQSFLTTKQAAEHLGLSHRTLEKWRVTGQGPSFRKHGARVLYALEDLTQWSGQNSRRSTSDPGESEAA